MTNSKMVDAVRVGDSLYERLSDGTLKPLVGRSDWKRVDAMTETHVEADSVTDIDGLPLDDTEWTKVKLLDPFKTPITIRLDTDVVEWFKTQGSRYQTKINAVLRQYVETHKKAS